MFHLSNTNMASSAWSMRSTTCCGWSSTSTTTMRLSTMLTLSPSPPPMLACTHPYVLHAVDGLRRPSDRVLHHCCATTRMPAVSQGRLERPAVRCTSLQLPAATFAFPLRVDTSRHDHARMTFPWQKDVPNTKSISRDSVAGCLSSF